MLTHSQTKQYSNLRFSQVIIKFINNKSIDKNNTNKQALQTNENYSDIFMMSDTDRLHIKLQIILKNSCYEILMRN